jgi:hypothetical protein
LCHGFTAEKQLIEVAMARKDNLDDYEVFYLELPQADYFEDVEIQDEYEPSNTDKVKGLSDEQVSEIARDSLNAANTNHQNPDQDQNLFSDDQGT